MEEIKCSKCGSNQITANKKGFSTGRAIAGGLLTGNIWLAAAGGVGMNEIEITCLSCGHTWKVKRNKEKQNVHNKTYYSTDTPCSAFYICDCGWRGNLQYGRAFCERCNKQLDDSHVVSKGSRSVENEISSSGCLVLLFIPLLITLATIFF